MLRISNLAIHRVISWPGLRALLKSATTSSEVWTPTVCPKLRASSWIFRRIRSWRKSRNLCRDRGRHRCRRCCGTRGRGDDACIARKRTSLLQCFCVPSIVGAHTFQHVARTWFSSAIPRAGQTSILAPSRLGWSRRWWR